MIHAFMRKSNQIICLFSTFFIFMIGACKKSHFCTEVHPAQIWCNNATREVNAAKQMILGDWNWIYTGRSYFDTTTYSPCKVGYNRVVRFTADNKVYFFKNGLPAEKYQYKIVTEYPILSPLPSDTLGILSFRDYFTGERIRNGGAVQYDLYFLICPNVLSFNYSMGLDFERDEYWQRIR